VGLGSDAAAEYPRAFFLTEVRAYLQSVRGIASHRDAIARVLCFVGEIDAALALAHLLEHDERYCRARAGEGSLVAVGIVHPLLPEGVPNDVQLGPRSLLVTGSNMAGKSTFLRTLGVEVVLAQTLGVACARSFECPPLRVLASMQVHDDLGASVSLYQAEVLRIRTLLERGAEPPPVLALLDEAFRGTNPTERIAAAGAVLLELARRNIVVAATHDLALAEITAASFDVGHFTERAGEEGVVFDYRLEPGISRSTNALALLERAGYPSAVVRRAEAIARAIEAPQI
jgi:DNA mismatch repair ATPase MutS